MAVFGNRRGVVAIVMGFRSKGLELTFYKSTSDIHQKEHLEFEVLCWSSKKSVSVASV